MLDKGLFGRKTPEEVSKLHPQLLQRNALISVVDMSPTASEPGVSWQQGFDG